MTKRRRVSTALLKATLLFASLGIAAFVGEVALRLLGYQAIYEVYSKPDVLWQHDELLGWSHEPGTQTTYVGPRPWPVEFESPVAINSLGLRGPELAPLPTDGLRVLFLGDSMVAGFEVADDETFVAVAGRLLSEALQQPVQTVNAGVRGYGTDQAYLYFRERGHVLQPHVVVMWLSTNDLVDDRTIHRMRRIFGKPAFVPEGASGLRLVGHPVPVYPECSELAVSKDGEILRLDSASGRLLCRLQTVLFDRSALFSYLTLLVPWEQWGDLLRSLYRLGVPSPTRPVIAESQGVEAPQGVTERILRALARDAEARGARLVLVSTPHMFRRFSEAGVRFDGFELVSLDAVEAADPRVVQFVHDSHLTAKGHRIAAEVLRDALLPILRERRAGAAGPAESDPSPGATDPEADSRSS